MYAQWTTVKNKPTWCSKNYNNNAAPAGTLPLSMAVKSGDFMLSSCHNLPLLSSCLRGRNCAKL